MAKSIPLLELKTQFIGLQEEIINTINQVLQKQSFILGPHVEILEKKLANFIETPHAISVSSGTDALLVSLMALGINSGDIVITSPFTFLATVSSIIRLKAIPLFVDIDPTTYNLNPFEVERILSQRKLSIRPKAIIPVHLFGQPSDMDLFIELANIYNLNIIEDASQAIGAIYPNLKKENKKVGSIGTTGCFSFFPSKNLGGAGDGGFITCKDDKIANYIKSIRTHGSHPKNKYQHIYIGGNFRLDTIQAAVIMTKLKYLSAWNAARRINAADYDRMFIQTNLINKGVISLPYRKWPKIKESHIFHQYIIRAHQRDQLIKTLNKSNIGHAIYYPKPIHLLKCFQSFNKQHHKNLFNSEKAAKEVIALPIYPELTIEQKERIVTIINDFYK